jgi:hypothetical protein
MEDFFKFTGKNPVIHASLHDLIYHSSNILILYMVRVFNATFNNISITSVSCIVEQTCHKSLTIFITSNCIEYTLPCAGFEIKILMVTGTDCIY